MKIIDLEYLLANGEEVPRMIGYEGEIYIYRDDLKDYENEYFDYSEGFNKYKYLFENPMGRSFDEFFNDEIYIFEKDKKIEKICRCDEHDMTSHGEMKKPNKNEEILRLKINEIIDVINKE